MGQETEVHERHLQWSCGSSGGKCVPSDPHRSRNCGWRSIPGLVLDTSFEWATEGYDAQMAGSCMAFVVKGARMDGRLGTMINRDLNLPLTQDEGLAVLVAAKVLELTEDGAKTAPVGTARKRLQVRLMISEPQ